VGDGTSSARRKGAELCPFLNRVSFRAEDGISEKKRKMPRVRWETSLQCVLAKWADTKEGARIRGIEEGGDERMRPTRTGKDISRKGTNSAQSFNREERTRPGQSHGGARNLLKNILRNPGSQKLSRGEGIKSATGGNKKEPGSETFEKKKKSTPGDQGWPPSQTIFLGREQVLKVMRGQREESRQPGSTGDEITLSAKGTPKSGRGV